MHDLVLVLPGVVPGLIVLGDALRVFPFFSSSQPCIVVLALFFATNNDECYYIYVSSGGARRYFRWYLSVAWRCLPNARYGKVMTTSTSDRNRVRVARACLLVHQRVRPSAGWRVDYMCHVWTYMRFSFVVEVLEFKCSCALI